MLYYIRFSDKIKRMMIDHTFKDPTKECGGFLFGNLTRTLDSVFCDIDAIYYEDRYGSDAKFTFGYTYIRNAKKAGRNFDSMQLMGTYHSHGQYPAVFSDVDRNELQKYFGANRVTLIYSPKYSHLVGEFLDTDGKSYKAKIITKK